VSERPEVLFVCVHNAGRSQMAAGLLELRSNGRIGALSAGTAPADEISPVVVAAMREVGVDVSKTIPRPLSTDDVRIADIVVTMGCGDSCPVLPGRRYEDWALDDPAGQDLTTVRRIRDEVDVRVQALVQQLVGEASVADRPAGSHR
jgi:arsenate reductase (thioredoxin)